MTTDDLTAALHACAAGLYPLEAGIALLISNGTFLHRGDFTSRFIDHGTSGSTRWPRSTGTLRSPPWPTGTCPAPEGNGVSSCCRPASPEASPSISATPSPSLDDGNVARLVTAIWHASGKRPVTSGY